jgi:hypothetical protein
MTCGSPFCPGSPKEKTRLNPNAKKPPLCCGPAGADLDLALLPCARLLQRNLGKKFKPDLDHN